MEDWRYCFRVGLLVFLIVVRYICMRVILGFDRVDFIDLDLIFN